jgi:hypothetical protein
LRRKKPHPERQEEVDDTRYPIGSAPTWKEITSCLLSNPTLLMPSWEEPSEIMERYAYSAPGSPERYAVEVFITFTCHIWILLHPSWRLRPERTIHARTLASALQCWSLDSSLEEIMDVEFKPCHSTQNSGPGRLSLTFSERRKVYFPEDARGLSKV